MASEKTTKPATSPDAPREGDQMRSDYDFRQLRGVVRGKYAERYADKLRVVKLDDDVAGTFSNEAAVNDALRQFLKGLPPTAGAS